MVRRGALYLIAVGALGCLIAAYFGIRGVVAISSGDWLGVGARDGGIPLLVLGAAFGIAAIRVVRMGREALALSRRPDPTQR